VLFRSANYMSKKGFILDSLTRPVTSRQTASSSSNNKEAPIPAATCLASDSDESLFASKGHFIKGFHRDFFKALIMAHRFSRSKARMSSDTHAHDDALAILASTFPAATEAERQRFLKARKGNLQSATEKLGEFMDWRVRHNLDSPEHACDGRTDEQDWALASKLALEWEEQQKEHESNQRFSTTKKRNKVTILPQIVNMYFMEVDHNNNKIVSPYRTKDSKLILHVLPAQVNKKFATAETYALAKAIYLDLKFDRHTSCELATIFIDVRPGRGWANPPAYTMMPFISNVSSVLHQYFPERLHQCIVYPLPKAAIWIWDIAKTFLDKRVVDAVSLIAGSDALTAEAPTKALSLLLEDDVIEKMEQRRVDLFL